MQEVEEERFQMKQTIQELRQRLSSTEDALKLTQVQKEEASAAAHGLREQVLLLTSERDRLRERIDNLVTEFSSLTEECRNLKESCRVLELENQDLVTSERELKDRLTLLDQPYRDEEADGAADYEDTQLMPSEGKLPKAKTSTVSEEDSENEREVYRCIKDWSNTTVLIFMQNSRPSGEE